VRHAILGTIRILAVAASAAVVAVPVLADKPPWAGKGEEREAKGEQDRGHDDRRDEKGGHHFADRHRTAVRDYYQGEFQAGRCPPGLAKKHDGCMPPGQAKKWAVGRPLPPEVVRYDVPPALVVQLGAPPAGYRYVRVAGDILLIAAGTGMIADAIHDLGRK